MSRIGYLPLVLSLSGLLSLDVVLPVFIMDLGGSIVIMGILYSAQSILRPLARIVSGMGSDVLGGKKIIALSIGFRTMAYVAFLNAHGLWLVALGMMLIAIAEGLEGPAFLSSTAYAIEDMRYAATTFGMALSIRMGPTIIAPLLTGYIADCMGVLYVFLAGLLLSAISLMLSLSLDVGFEDKCASRGIQRNYHDLIRGNFLLLLSFTFLLFLIASSFRPIFSYWMVRVLNYSYTSLGLLMSIGAMLTLPSRIYTGMLSDRIRHVNVLLGVGILRSLALLVLVLRSDLPCISIAYLAYRALMAAPPRNALISELVDKKQYNIAFSIVGIAMDAGRMLGPAIMGYVVSNYGFKTGYAVMILIFMMYMLVVFILKGRIYSGKENT